MGVKLVKYGIGKSGSTGVTSHDKLTDRDLARQHPIGAIDGLQEALESVTGINDTTETNSLKLEYDPVTKILKGSVKVDNSSGNMLQINENGLFIKEVEDVKHLTADQEVETASYIIARI